VAVVQREVGARRGLRAERVARREVVVLGTRPCGVAYRGSSRTTGRQRRSNPPEAPARTRRTADRSRAARAGRPTAINARNADRRIQARAMPLVGRQIAFRCVPRRLPVLRILEQVGGQRTAGAVFAVEVPPEARKRVVAADIHARSQPVAADSVRPRSAASARSCSRPPRGPRGCRTDRAPCRWTCRSAASRSRGSSGRRGRRAARPDPPPDGSAAASSRTFGESSDPGIFTETPGQTRPTAPSSSRPPRRTS